MHKTLSDWLAYIAVTCYQLIIDRDARGKPSGNQTMATRRDARSNRAVSSHRAKAEEMT
jgi:hypothetical protein